MAEKMTLGQALKEIISRRGRSIFNDPDLLKAMLLDLAPAEKKNIQLLMVACGSHSFDYLSRCSDSQIPDAIDAAVKNMSNDLSESVVDDIRKALYEAFSLKEQEAELIMNIQPAETAVQQKSEEKTIRETPPAPTPEPVLNSVPVEAKKKFNFSKIAVRVIGLAAGVLIGMLVFGMLPSCNSSSSPANKNSSKDVKTVRLAADEYGRFHYLDNGVLAGYNIAVAEAVDELIPEVQFEYVYKDFDSLFTGLENGEFDMIAAVVDYTYDRGEKYLFGGSAYMYDCAVFVTNSRNNKIKSLVDLNGKVLAYSNKFSEAVDEKIVNSNSFELVRLTECEDDETALQMVDTGEADACLVSLKYLINNFGENARSMYDVYPGINLWNDFYSFVSLKDSESEELMKKIDTALEQLLENGTLRDLSLTYFGFDFSALYEIDYELENW